MSEANNYSDIGEIVPVRICECCAGTIWRDRDYFQCTECGATSTKYGGHFPSQSGKPCPDFVEKVNAVRPIVFAQLKDILDKTWEALDAAQANR